MYVLSLEVIFHFHPVVAVHKVACFRINSVADVAQNIPKGWTGVIRTTFSLVASDVCA